MFVLAAKSWGKYHRSFSKPRDGVTKEGTMIYFARQHDCEACALKPKCCPNVPARKIARSIHEAARDKARTIAKTEAYAVSRRERKKVEMLFAHLKRILRLDRLRLRGPSGAKDEFLLAATAQNLRKLAKLIPLPAPIFATWGEVLKSAALIVIATAIRSYRSRGSSTQFAHNGHWSSSDNGGFPNDLPLARPFRRWTSRAYPDPFRENPRGRRECFRQADDSPELMIDRAHGGASPEQQ
jgi:hypothetical protein